MVNKKLMGLFVIFVLLASISVVAFPYGNNQPVGKAIGGAVADPKASVAGVCLKLWQVQ